MTEKQSKFGFKIKLTSETSEKLKQESQSLEKEVKPNIINPSVSSKEEKTEDEQMEQSRNASDDSEPEDENNEAKDDSSERVKATDIDKKTSQEFPQLLAKSSENDEYAKHVHYEGDVAIYTDPSNKQRFIWDNELNEWALECDKSGGSNDSGISSDPTEQSDEAGAYGFENNTHTYIDKDGSAYIWDKEKSAWFPKVDDDFLAQYQMSYGFIDNTTSTEKEKPAELPQEMKGEKKKAQEEPKWFDVAEEQNTNVYVSNLPLDVTEEEFVDVMQKCGLVMRDPSSQKMKIKLYTKPNSQQLKGDALCTYIKIESVNLALSILDGYTLRNHKIKVQKARFQMKGDFNPALKPKKKRKKDKEKLKKMQEKLFDWRPEKMRGERSKHEKVVIIKNLFEPSLFDNEVQLILEYQQDMREECSKCGEVKRVVLYDRHPEGVAQVTMKDPEEADNVIKLINGRWFGKRQLTAEIWDGKTKYKMEETDADIHKRIDEFGNFLESDGTVKAQEGGTVTN